MMGIRRIHTVPRLHFDSSKGVPGLYSPEALKVAWHDQQQHVLNKLNSVIVDTEHETRVPFHIMLATRTKPETAHIFNYASQAHNNHLFFSGLNSAGVATQPTGSLLRRINENFGDLNGLKRAIDRAASQVLSSGWVFLVEQPNKQLTVVASNVAGSPATYSRKQSLDLNGEVTEDAQAELAELQNAVSGRRQNWNMELFALNLWQHAYVPEFSFAGRQQFIDAWWKALDWTKVDQRLFKGRI